MRVRVFAWRICISVISVVQIQDRTILQSEVNSAVLQLEEFQIDKAFLNFQGIASARICMCEYEKIVVGTLEIFRFKMSAGSKARPQQFY